MSILVLADLHEGQLASATAHVVAAAQAIGGDIDVLVAGEGVQAAADAAAALRGAAAPGGANPARAPSGGRWSCLCCDHR